ncbi:MAG TPA: ABC transporter [Desulfobacteraceae bacterium]|nr:ABC transporter [Desulfobacteraceae bacterium]
MKGLYTIFKKELCDHFSSYRFVILFALIAMISVITSYMVGVHLKENLKGLANTKFPFLMLFSTAGALFSMVQFVGFFGPLIGLVLGFDSINRERAHRTLVKLVSQPIYRDSVINGKFLAGVTTITIMLVSIVMAISGFGMAFVGLVPGIEEVLRLFLYILISIFYISFWLGISIMFSTFFDSIATSALASVALWIFLSFFVPLGANVAANTAAPINSQKESQIETLKKNLRVKEMASLFSPTVLYSEATATIIDPRLNTTRASSVLGMGPVEQLLASRFKNPLPLNQSIIVVLPHITALVAITMICFAISYITFMIQEIRT